MDYFLKQLERAGINRLVYSLRPWQAGLLAALALLVQQLIGR